MNTYELTIVLKDPTSSKDSAGAGDKVIKMITDFAKKTKGEVNKQESWGAKHLAYPIKKLAIAQYEHFVVTLEPAQQVVLEKMLHMDESILRYMFVRV
jgi:small subunit ribosomal protein S6